MNCETKAELGARFKLITRKANGSITNETSWFNNIVLDAGLDRMSVGAWGTVCCVGTGNSTPVPTQVALDNFVASTTAEQLVVSGNQVSVAPYYWWTRKTWRFGLGVAAGNLSEVGIGWSTTSLWDRSLIKDINGNPTTITVLSDEYLDVVSEVRVYPAQSFSGSFNLLDKMGAIVSTHTYTGKPYIVGPGAWLANTISTPDQWVSLDVCSGAIGASVTANPTGVLVSIPGGVNTKPTPRSSRYTCTLSLAQANGSIRSFVIPLTGIMKNGSKSGHQVEISPPIEKDNTQIMTFTFEVSWDRYEPT